LRQTPQPRPIGQRKKEGAGEGNTSDCEAWICCLLLVANASDHQFVILSKTDRKQNGDIWENHWDSAPRREQFTPANPQFVPNSFRFNPVRVKIIYVGESLG